LYRLQPFWPSRSHWLTRRFIDLLRSSPAAIIKVVLQKLNIEFELNPLATAASLQQKKAAGQPYGSVIVVMGASLKGMGAAGISIEDEIKEYPS